ncbi:7213_t:CDS:2 [Gigaspora rosea]|nr:7213_t:CDS:2 [Gigaspora rosea]
MNSALRTQKRNKNEQDTSSSVSKKTSKYNEKNEKQQNNNVASSQLSESTSIKNINQRREDYDDAVSTNHENNNITLQVSLSEDESDNSSVISSPIYENNETISPHLVSSAHENNEATSSHPVSSVHETDVSLPQENDIALPAHRSVQFQQVDNEFEIALWLARHKRILDLATNIRNGMKTRVDERDKEHATTAVSSILHEPTLKLPEIDQSARHSSSELGIIVQCYMKKLFRGKVNEEFRALNERFVVNDDKFCDSEIFTQLKNFVHQVIKAVLVAQDNHKDTQNAVRKCDEYTIDLEIPTKFGIVKSLPVRELLDY